MDMQQDTMESTVPYANEPTKEPVQESKKESKKGCGCTPLYIMFLMFGVGSLLPFNCYITPYEYMTKYYPKSSLSFFSLFYNVGNWGMMFIYLKVGKKMPALLSNLIVFIVWIICLTILPILAFLPIGNIPRFVIAIILVFVSGVLNGICFPKIISVGSRISFDLVQAMMSGNGVAGIITAALYAITKGIAAATSNGTMSDNQLLYGTLSYFILSDVILLVCIFCWIKVMKDYPHLNYDEAPKEEIKMELSFTGNAPTSQERTADGHSSASLGTENIDTVRSAGTMINPKTGQNYTFMQLVRVLLIPGLGVFFVFFITLAFFPSITGKIPYVDGNKNKINDNGWWSVGMTSLFMIFDYVGRSLPQIKVLTRIGTTPLLIFSVLRIVFGALFLLMAVPIPSEDNTSIIMKITKINAPLQNDYVSTITMILFALTNGYVSTVIMIRYGDHVPHPSYMATSGDIMAFWLNTGLIVGGLASLFIDVGINPKSLDVN